MPYLPGGFNDTLARTLGAKCVAGELTLRGVTRPVELKILSFKCMAHPLNKRDWCGADAVAVIDRAAYRIDSGKQWGFKMQVNLRSQVEALALP